MIYMFEFPPNRWVGQLGMQLGDTRLRKLAEIVLVDDESDRAHICVAEDFNLSSRQLQ